MIGTRPTARDAVIAALLAVAGVAELLLLQHAAVTLIGVGVATAALLGRRGFPLTCALVVVLATVLGPGATTYAELGAAMVALYGVPVHAHGRWRLAAAALLAVAPLLTFLPQLSFGIRLVLWTVPIALGVVVRAVRERQRELAARIELLREERAEGARIAMFAERVRIARELHDVVAHHVSAMGVQAAAARLVMGARPDQAAAALGEIQKSSRTALAELNQLVGYLRPAEWPASCGTPQRSAPR